VKLFLWCTALLALAAPALGQKCHEDDPFEPNDRCGEALALEPGFYSWRYLVPESREDRWRILVPAGEPLEVDVIFYQSLADLDAWLLSADCSTTLQQATSSSDHELLRWTNGTGSDVEVVLRVAGVPGVACGNYMLDVRLGDPGPFAPFCFGNDPSEPCPCGNGAGPRAGCRNANGVGGRLTAQGSTSVALDDLVLRGASLVAGKPALLFVGASALDGSGSPLGDGLRCVGGPVVRLGTAVPDGAGVATFGPGLGALGGWSAGERRHFQIWYRDFAASPCASSSNSTHGLSAHFSG